MGEVTVVSGSGVAPDSEEGRELFASFFGGGTPSSTLQYFRHSTPPGDATERHVHTAAVAVYVVKGSMEVSSGPGYATHITVGPGDYLHIPEGLPHDEQVIGDEEVEFLVAHLRGFHTLSAGE